MSELRDKLRIFDRIDAGKNVHVLALGESNTEHFMVGAHWFDYVNMGFMHTYRKWTSDRSSVDNPALCLNAGTSNNTTAELLARFDRDVTPFKPDLLILTAGVNDANPNRNLSREMMHGNMVEIRRRVNSWGGDVLFQTCYCCDYEKFREKSPQWADNYEPYMEVVRSVAGEYLNDNYSRWKLLHDCNIQSFRLLMRDHLHLNPVGNAVIGLDLIRLLGLTLPDENLPWITGGVFARDCMDLLEKGQKAQLNKNAV